MFTIKAFVLKLSWYRHQYRAYIQKNNLEGKTETSLLTWFCHLSIIIQHKAFLALHKLYEFATTKLVPISDPS